MFRSKKKDIRRVLKGEAQIKISRTVVLDRLRTVAEEAGIFRETVRNL